MAISISATSLRDFLIKPKSTTISFSYNRCYELCYAQKVCPSKIVLLHGDQPSIEWMEKRIEEKLPQTEVIVPEPSQEIEN